MKILNRQESEITSLSNCLEKRPFLVLGIFIFLLFAGLPALKAQDRVVNPEDDLSSIIDNLTSGETITLNPGIYDPLLIQNKNFTANNPLILKAAGDSVIIERASEQWINPNPTIDGDSYDAATFRQCSYIAIEGIEFVGGDRGVTVHDSDHIIFRDCDVTQTLEAGVKVENNSEYIDFIDCLFAYTGLGDVARQKRTSFGEAIYVGRGSYKYLSQWPDATKYVWIEGCEFHNTGRGEAINIKAEAFHCTVRDNDIHDVALNVYDYDQTNSGAISLDHNLGYQGTTYREGERRENWVENNRITTIRSGIQPWEPYVDERSASRRRIAGIYSAGTGNNIVGNTVNDVSNGTLSEEANGIRFNHWSNDTTKNVIWNNEVTNTDDGNDFDNLEIEQNPLTNPNSAQSWYPVGGSANSVSFDPTPTSISNGDNTVTLDYSIDQNGVVVVQVFDASWNYIDQFHENVSAGTGVSTLNLNVSGFSEGDYLLRAELREADWTVMDTRADEWVPFSDGTPPADNSLSFNPTPTSISNGDNTVTLDYSIDQNGVVVVQVFDANWNYIDQFHENVSVGTGVSTLNLNVSGFTEGDYLLRAELREADWTVMDTRADEWVPFSGGTPPADNSVSFDPTPTSISNGDNTMTLNYSIEEDGIVLVQLYSGSTYIEQAYANVSSGSGQSTLTLNVDGLSAGNYRLQAELRDASWITIDGTQVSEEVTFSGTPPPPSGSPLSWDPIPTSISNGDNQVTLNYSIDQDGIVVVQLYSGWTYIKQIHADVSSGSGQSTLTLNVDGLSAGNYRLQAELRDAGWITIDGTQVSEEVPFNGNAKIVADLSQNIHLSPNPANQNIQLVSQLSENTQAQIQIYDAFGKLVKHIKEVEILADSPTNLDVSQLPAGMYFYNLQSDKWQTVKKFVIAR